MVIAIAFGMKYLLVFQVFDAFILYVLKAIHWFSSFESLMNKNIPLSILEVGVLLLGIYFLKFLIKDFFNIKYVLRLSVCLLLFFGLRIGFNIYNYEKSEVLVHHFYKEKIISVKNKDQIVFWLKEQRNQEKMIDFVVNPYLVSRRISNYEIKYYPDDADAFVFEGTKYHLK